jgi:DNA invertase Pin-like site-specific DNA recombinase
MNATHRTSKPFAPSTVIGYVRVSTDDQALGPEAQRAALEAWAVRNGASLVAVFEDLGVSGGAPLDKRPGLLAAVDALADHGADALIVAKRDRLARDTMAAAMIERLADRAGARIVSADGVGDGDGPESLLMRRIVDAFAEYERALIRGRTRAALAAKKARGERAGEVPFGCRLADDGRTLEADAGEAAVVDAVRELRAAGLSIRGIAAELDRRGFRSRAGKPLAPTQVARILERAA